MLHSISDGGYGCVVEATYIPISVAVFADKSARSPQKLIVFIQENKYIFKKKKYMF